MVAGRNAPNQLSCNTNPYSARNLLKKDLAGVIFGCSHSTFKECISNQLFGLPALHIKYVQNVTPGMPVFLFNYSDRTLHGIFEATSAGKMYINRYAWTSDGQELTSFPAQVRVKVHKECQPLREDKYKAVLAKNYLEHEPNHLWFELDFVQTKKLISLFSASQASPCVSFPPTVDKCGTLFRHSAAPAATNIKKEQGFRNPTGTLNGEKREPGFCYPTETLKGEKKTAPVFVQDLALDMSTAIPEKKWSSLFKAQYKPPASKHCEDFASERGSYTSEDDPLCLSEVSPVNEVPLVISGRTSEAKSLTVASEATSSVEVMSSVLSSDLRPVVNKLIQEMGEIKELHSRQTQKIQYLELELKEAYKKLQNSELHCQKSRHSSSSLSASHLKETQFEIQDVYQSILLVGGFDGSSWLQNLDCYCPFEDVIRPLAQMKSDRSYASSVKLDEKLYVLGGGYGLCWYDTVESYDLKCHQWVTCPSLGRKKGNLAAVSVDTKIFAIGGGNASDIFSEVEVLDLHAGKWMVTRSMAQKRYAPAVAEMNGVIYVAGGYGGDKYLSSVERFDPRESSWKNLKNMHSKRGCHSLTVLNEKLYAIGGYDGTQMIPTVEVFEPRIGSWTISDPLTYARGYMGSVNFGEKIYTIGGMQENNGIIDTVECYSESDGWKLAQLKSIGKRCFFSAVAV